MKRIVVVDDSRSILALITMALNGLVKSGSIELVEYLNPIEFYTKIANGTEDFDLLICDINMPQVNGLELVKKLKEAPHLGQKPMLMLTTENTPEMKQKGRDIGITGWIVKPFEAPKLEQTIMFILGL